MIKTLQKMGIEGIYLNKSYMDFTPWKKRYDQSRQHIKKQRHYFANKGPSSQGYGFSSSHVWMSWTRKKAECQRINTFEL